LAIATVENEREIVDLRAEIDTSREFYEVAADVVKV